MALGYPQVHPKLVHQFDPDDPMATVAFVKAHPDVFWTAEIHWSYARWDGDQQPSWKCYAKIRRPGPGQRDLSLQGRSWVVIDIHDRAWMLWEDLTVWEEPPDSWAKYGAVGEDLTPVRNHIRNHLEPDGERAEAR